MSNYSTCVIDEVDCSESPALTSMIYTQLNDRFLQEELETSLKEQYMGFKDLGYNFLEDYDNNQITPEILIDMMEYIDENYLGIEYRYQINDLDRNTFTLIPMLYEILFVDMVKFILPNLMKELNTEDPNDIKKLDPNTLKFNLLLVAKNTLVGLEEAKNLGSGLGNNKIAYEIVKFSYCLDLFDSDLTEFLENYIFPVCNNYNTIICMANV